MAKRIFEPDILMSTRELLRAALQNLDEAGFALSAAHLDMVMHVLEMEISDRVALTTTPPTPDFMRHDGHEASLIRQSAQA